MVDTINDWVHETSTTTGTGNKTLTELRRRFSDVWGTGGSSVFFYSIHNRDVPEEYEYGLGHMSDADTLVSDSVVGGSNGTSAVNFSAGTKDVTNDLPASVQAGLVRSDTSQGLSSSAQAQARANVGLSGNFLSKLNSGVAPNEGLTVKYVSATSVDIDAAAVVLFDSSNMPRRLGTVDLTAAITTSGVNGLDTGSEASATWYAIYVIAKSGSIATSTTTSTTSNKLVDSGANFTTAGVKVGNIVNNTTDGTSAIVTAIDSGTQLSVSADIFTSGEAYEVIDVAALLSASFSSPTLPSGYTQHGFVGAVRNDGSSDFLPFVNHGGRVLQASSGSLISVGSATTFTNVDLTTAVPPNAKIATIDLQLFTSSGTATITAVLAPAGSGISATYGDQRFQVVTSTGAFESPVSIHITTAQQIVYRLGGTNARATIQCRGYEF